VIKHYFKVWMKLIKIQLIHDMAYPSQFFLFFIGSFFIGFLGPIFGIIVYGVSKGFPGWTLNQFVLLQGTFMFVFGLMHMFLLAAVWRVRHSVQTGNFDKYMLRPIKILPYILMQGMDFDGLGSTLSGVFLITYALTKIGINPLFMLEYLFLIVLSFIFVSSITIITIGLSFIVIQSEAIMQAFNMFLNVVKYPLTIYGSTIKFAISFIVPLGIVSFYPSQALISGLSASTIAYLTLSVVLFATFSYSIFRLGLSKYQSAGG